MNAKYICFANPALAFDDSTVNNAKLSVKTEKVPPDTRTFSRRYPIEGDVLALLGYFEDKMEHDQSFRIVKRFTNMTGILPSGRDLRDIWAVTATTDSQGKKWNAKIYYDVKEGLVMFDNGRGPPRKIHFGGEGSRPYFLDVNQQTGANFVSHVAAPTDKY